MFAALAGVGGWLSIDVGPVPFSLQVLFSLLSGLVLGARLGAYSQFVYILMGLVGVPVFANRMAGVAPLLGPTGGFLIGFAAGAAAAGWLAARLPGLLGSVAGVAAGLVAIYAAGVLWLGRFTGDMGTALAAGVLPFVLPDLIKASSAVALTRALERRGFETAGSAGTGPAGRIS